MLGLQECLGQMFGSSGIDVNVRIKAFAVELWTVVSVVNVGAGRLM